VTPPWQIKPFWPLVLALSLINFGVDFVVGGLVMATAYQMLLWAGSWMTVAGVGILVWLVLSR
jgi:hypothetical protein